MSDLFSQEKEGDPSLDSDKLAEASGGVKPRDPGLERSPVDTIPDGDSSIPLLQLVQQLLRYEHVFLYGLRHAKRSLMS